MRVDQPLLTYFGHHKAGTTWIHSIISSICHELGLRHAVVHNPGMFGHDLHRFVADQGIDFLSYTNADMEYVQNLENFVGFHVVRDLRDSCVSAFYSHLYSHPLDPEYWPQLERIRLELQTLTKEDGLRREIELFDWQANQLRSWNYKMPHVLEIKMETLVENPYQGFLDVFEFLKLLANTPFSGQTRMRHVGGIVLNRIFSNTRFRLNPFGGLLPPERLLGIVWEHSFQRKTGGRTRGEEDTRNHYRRGKPGDWRTHFNEGHKKLFKQRHNDVLIQLGYELTNDW